jgi:glycosyltransferase involved in cell wall biosynthesis
LKKDSRIKLINTLGLGLVDALNIGIEAASKDWVARFDVDDQYSPMRLKEQRRLIGADVSIIFSDYEFVTYTGKQLGIVYSAVFPYPTALSLISGQRTAHSSALVNRKCLIASGGYLIQDYPAEDLALWLRMSSHGKIISVPLPLLHYQLSENSISGQNRDSQIRKRDQLTRNHNLWLSWQNNCLETLNQTLLGYNQLSNAPERILLHLRDLHLAKKITKIQTPFMKIVVKIGPAMLLKIFYSGLKMWVMTLIRRYYRFTHQYF